MCRPVGQTKAKLAQLTKSQENTTSQSNTWHERRQLKCCFHFIAKQVRCNLQSSCTSSPQWTSAQMCYCRPKLMNSPAFNTGVVSAQASLSTAPPTARLSWSWQSWLVSSLGEGQFNFETGPPYIRTCFAEAPLRFRNLGLMDKKRPIGVPKNGLARILYPGCKVLTPNASTVVSQLAPCHR